MNKTQLVERHNDLQRRLEGSYLESDERRAIVEEVSLIRGMINEMALDPDELARRARELAQSGVGTKVHKEIYSENPITGVNITYGDSGTIVVKIGTQRFSFYPHQLDLIFDPKVISAVKSFAKQHSDVLSQAAQAKQARQGSKQGGKDSGEVGKFSTKPG